MTARVLRATVSCEVGTSIRLAKIVIRLQPGHRVRPASWEKMWTTITGLGITKVVACGHDWTVIEATLKEAPNYTVATSVTRAAHLICQAVGISIVGTPAIETFTVRRPR